MQTTHLPRQTPESQGIESSRIAEFIDAIEAAGIEFHGFVLARHGNVIAEAWWEPYSAERPHYLYSYTKSFVSTAAGFAIDEGLFGLDDLVTGFFPDELPREVSPNLATMKVRHLLSMSTGHTTEPKNTTDNWVANFLAAPVEKEPGTHFLYNSMATYMVSAIVQKTSGQRVVDFLEPRLFAPLGIEKLRSERCPRGIDFGGWGMSATTEDMAKLAQLYLQRGVWEGRLLLSERWVAAATSKQIANGDNPDSDWNQGYGFQFWRCRHGAYRGDGAFGQFGIVLPEQDAVIAITSLVLDMQPTLDLVWKHLLPAFQPNALPGDPRAEQTLRARLSNLAIAAPAGTTTSSTAARVSGKTYRFAANDQGISALRFDFDSKGGRITLTDARGTHGVAFGYDTWQRGTTTYATTFVRQRDELATAGRGAWIADDTFRLRISLCDTMFCPVITCRFHDTGVTYDMQGNIGFDNGTRPELAGTND